MVKMRLTPNTLHSPFIRARMRTTMAEAITLFYRAADGALTETADAGVIPQAVTAGDGLLWVDLTVGKDVDVESVLRDVFRFHPLTIEDCISTVVDPAKIDDHGEYVFIVVQAMTEYRPHEELNAIEVDFYLGRNYVVSVRHEPVPAINKFKERCRKDDYVLTHSADWLLHGLLDALVDEYLPIVDAVDETIDELEESVLHQPNTVHLSRILTVKRNSLRLRRATTPQRDIMNRLSRGEYSQLISQEAAMYYRDVYDHLVRIEYLVEALRDLADGALQTYLSVVSNRLNEVMKVLTVAATILLPLTLIASIYGMNFTHNQFPAFEDAWGFPAIIGAMTAIAVALLVYFRYRHWI